jgi:hypothetical protein
MHKYTSDHLPTPTLLSQTSYPALIRIHSPIPLFLNTDIESQTGENLQYSSDETSQEPHIWLEPTNDFLLTWVDENWE